MHGVTAAPEMNERVFLFYLGFHSVYLRVLMPDSAYGRVEERNDTVYSK